MYSRLFRVRSIRFFVFKNRHCTGSPEPDSARRTGSTVRVLMLTIARGRQSPTRPGRRAPQCVSFCSCPFALLLLDAEPKAMQAVIHDRLCRRLLAPKRIGCPYRLAAFSAAPGFNASAWLPGEVMARFFAAA
jgi:hypothetical protein